MHFGQVARAKIGQPIQDSPEVTVHPNGGQLIFFGTGKYLEPAAGKVNWNIFAMAREGLRYELNSLFQNALRQKDAVTLKNAFVRKMLVAARSANTTTPAPA